MFKRARRFGASLVVLGLLSSLFALVAPAAGALEPQHVSFTLEGCDQDMTFTLPNGSGKFICPDARYGTGNLGKNWNELDLVPFRFTADTGNAAPDTQTYGVGIAVDREKVGRPGYDVLSAPELNAALSSATGCGSLSVGPESLRIPGFGGVDKSLTRKLTVTGQAKNTECVYDFYARLALGSHLFPGSSLHANITDEGFIGTNQDRSIPVNEILPQELSKGMSATQGTDHVWNVTKKAEPASLAFDETCGIEAARSKSVDITVEWVKLPATPSGEITLVTNIYAKNPASRTITVNVTDNIRTGTTVVDTASSGDVDVPANTNLKVLTNTTTVPAGSANLNDVATATYTDKVTGVAVPGTTQATASATVQASGPELNQNATISDVESISGDHFSYSVDSFTGAGGAFDGGYVAGTKTTADVSWTSASQSGSGSVTFTKTVYVDGGTVGSGTLADVARLTGSDGYQTSANASVALSADASVSLTINKSIPDVLQGGETQTFGFKVWGQGTNPATGTPVETASIAFSAGQTSKSTTVSGLAPGIYFVTEDHADGWTDQPQSAAVDLSVKGGTVVCSGSVTFTNSFGSANARVVKTTTPAGNEDDWTMCLAGPGTQQLAGGKECRQTDGDGEVAFQTPLQEGSYTITEGLRTGWRQTASQNCAFDVNYPADQSRTFTCTFHNEQLGKILIQKLVDPDNGETFDFTLKGGPSALNQSFSLGDGNIHDSGYVRAGSGYVAAETLPEGWDQSLVSCDDDDSTVGNISVDPGETVTCTFANTKRGLIIIKKVTDPVDAAQPFDFTLSGGPTELNDSFSLTGGRSRQSEFVEPGRGYAAAEDVPEGWDQTSATCDDGSGVGDIDVQPGEIVTCTFVNTQRGVIVVQKVTNPAGADQPFDFSLLGGTSELNQSFSLTDGDSHESGYVRPGDGYAASETLPIGWDQTAASCDDESPVDDIRVSPGETVTCTFENTQRGQIVIRKVTNPGGTADSFPFTLVGGPSGIDESFSLVDGGAHESGFVKPGSGYSARENVPSDWTQTSATCDDGSVPSDIDVSPNEVVTCTFTNTAKPNGISLDKKVNGADHASIGDALLAHDGDPLTYTVVITNTGQVPLTITALSDSLYAGFAAACSQGVGSVLAVGASFTCTYPVSAAGDAHNVAAVDAVDSLKRPVTDSDDTFVDVIHPAISIVKTANPESVSGSGPVTYTYVVTNTGDTDLFGVIVTDDILGTIGTVGSLAPGESVTMSKTVIVDVSTPPTNIGVATGTDVLGEQVTASDTATITVVLPAVLELPRTGVPLDAQTRAAIMLIEVGIFMTLAGRRRRAGRRAD